MKTEALVEMIKKTATDTHAKRYSKINMKKRYKPDQKLAEDDEEETPKKGKFNRIELNPEINSINQAR